ncbi:uncharacterized protein METZ01_LOCUS278101, partial [marine metagenome]
GPGDDISESGVGGRSRNSHVYLQ